MPGIGISISPFISSGGQSWRSYWTTTPYFALPATGLSLVVGQTVTIYGDSLVDVAMSNSFSVIYTCDIGSASGNDYVINPVVGNIGNHDLTMVFKNGTLTYLTKTISFSVLAKATGQTLNLLMIGDSTIAGREDAEGIPIDASLSGCTITYLGTQGAGTRKSEGYSGCRMKDFVDGISQPSKFVKVGVLDIPAYFTDNSIAVPDVVWIRLGVNDVGYFTDSQILGYFDTFIDAFLNYNKSLQIIVSLPNTGTNNATKWALSDLPANHDPFTTRIHQFHKALTDHYAGGVYNARVDCSYEVYCLDRDAGYTNSVHQDGTVGDPELAGALVAYLSKKIDNPLNGLLSYWKLDEVSGNAVDSCGLYNGTPDNVTQNVVGKIGKGVEFTGPTVGYVNMGAISLTTSFAISLWVKRGTLTTDHFLVGFNNWGGIALSTDAGHGGFCAASGTNLKTWFNLLADKLSFHHFVFVVRVIDVTNGKMELYLDGVSVGGEITCKTEAITQFVLGRPSMNGALNQNYSFIGIEDEVVLYKKNINAVQIAGLYNSGNGKSYPF